MPYPYLQRQRAFPKTNLFVVTYIFKKTTSKKSKPQAGQRMSTGFLFCACWGAYLAKGGHVRPACSFFKSAFGQWLALDKLFCLFCFIGASRQGELKNSEKSFYKKPCQKPFTKNREKINFVSGDFPPLVFACVFWAFLVKGSSETPKQMYTKEIAISHQKRPTETSIVFVFLGRPLALTFYSIGHRAIANIHRGTSGPLSGPWAMHMSSRAWAVHHCVHRLCVWGIYKSEGMGYVGYRYTALEKHGTTNTNTNAAQCPSNAPQCPSQNGTSTATCTAAVERGCGWLLLAQARCAALSTSSMRCPWAQVRPQRGLFC
jgi:hypothetical protein